MLDTEKIVDTEVVETSNVEAPELEPEPVYAMAKDKDGNSVRVYARPMTRREMRALREKGLDPTFWEEKRVAIKVQSADANNPEVLTQAYLEAADAMDAMARKDAQFIDAILDIVYPQFDFDDTPQPDCVRLARETYQLTQGRPAAVKNS